MNDNLDIYYLSGYDILKKMITNLKFEKNIRVKDFKFQEYDKESIFLINSAYIDFLREFIKRHNKRTYIYSHGFSYYSYMKTKTLGANYFLLETAQDDSVFRLAGYIKQKHPDAFVITSFAVDQDGYTRKGIPLKKLAAQ